MFRISERSGTFRRVTGSEVSSAAAIIGSEAFFEPSIRNCPCRRAPPLITNASICGYPFLIDVDLSWDSAI
jgi:hypothetical protein